MVSHNILIHEDTFRTLKELKDRMSHEEGKNVSFTKVISELLGHYDHNPYEDDREMSYEEAFKVSKR